jgi:hypothetical protein
MTTENPFMTRLAVFVGSDILLTVLITYVPADLSALRWLGAAVQLAFMAATMAIATQWVLEDY